MTSRGRGKGILIGATPIPSATQRQNALRQGVEEDSDLDGASLAGVESKNVEEIFDDLGFGYYQIQLLLICGGSRAAYGSSVQLLALIQGCIMLEWGLDDVYESVLTGSVFAGQIFGMLTLGPLADYYGRRPIIIVGWVFIVIFGLIACLATDIWFLIAVETLVGVGLGTVQALTYDLFLETVPTKYRSRVMYISLFTVLGELYVVAIAWAVLSTWGWRWLAFFAMLPIICVSLVGFFVMEESARWLVTQGQSAEAEKVLAVIGTTNGKNGYTVILKDTKAALESEGFESFAELFSPKLWDTTLLLWSVQ